jgi:protein O-mannosyl-transferase
MSKGKKQTTPIITKATEASIEPNQVNTSFIEKWGKYVLLIFGFLLYANTLGHNYTQDDAIVIYDNMYTQKGFAGIPGLLSKDTFHGFFKSEGKAKLVSGGRYRPFTPIMFAIEFAIFGKNPFIGHMINALLYGLLGFVLFQLLCKVFAARNDYEKNYQWVIFSAVLIYLSHPIHTEAVANIKGRDEIMALLGSLVATYWILDYVTTKNVKYAIGSFIAFLIGLLSKENTITFAAIIPMILMFFYGKKLSESLKNIWPILVATVLFLIIRTSVLGLDTGGTPMELMNNPFLKWDGSKYVAFSFMEKMATIIFTLGKYISLLFFPHPLTHDYYPRHIEMMTFGDSKVIMSLLTYIGLLLASIYYYTKDRVITFSIWFFLITLSIVSNIVFPIGTNMSERFMFMPSVGFCLLIAHLLYKIFNNGKYVLGLSVLFSVLFSVKTFTRNLVWKDDFTLFTTDVKTSKNSAKILNAAGGTLTTKAETETDSIKKVQYLTEAVGYLEQAKKVHPTYANPMQIAGNAYYYLKNYDKSIAEYTKAIELQPNNIELPKNLAVICRDAGRYYGEKLNDIGKAKKYLTQSYSLYNGDAETIRLLGISYGMSGDHAQALEYFQKFIALDPNNASGYVNLSNAYALSGNPSKAQEAKAKALQLDPKIYGQ